MLEKRNRLTKRGSFNYVYKRGVCKSSGELKLTYVLSRAGAPKIGISVPNAVGNAVVRNKIRRRIRAALRGYVGNIKPAQIVVSARKGAHELTYAQICDKLNEMLINSELYEKKEINAVARD